MQETNQTLAPTYERLAEWKEKKGIRTKILTVEYIDSTDTSEDPMPLKIKRALKEYYHQDMKYVLLGGGVDVVPSEICFIWAKIWWTTSTLRVPFRLILRLF